MCISAKKIKKLGKVKKYIKMKTRTLCKVRIVCVCVIPKGTDRAFLGQYEARVNEGG